MLHILFWHNLGSYLHINSCKGGKQKLHAHYVETKTAIWTFRFVF